MNEAIAYYGKNFGFGEAAVIRDDKGQPTLAFIQVSKNTFIELGPATAERPAGINHFGIHVDDVKAATANLRQRGVKIDDPRVGRTISFITSVTDPAGVRMELSEIGPESMLGKAIASWR
jgi:predicted enzyme related to lactoylglutathione lyase